MDFPQLRNFPSCFAAVSRNGGIPLRLRFFYALLQGLVRSCRELILKVKLRGEFSIFSALFSPLLRVDYRGVVDFQERGRSQLPTGWFGVAAASGVRVGGRSGSTISSIHAPGDRAGPALAGVAAPAIPGLAALAVGAPAGAHLVDFVAGEVAHHPVDGGGRELLAIGELPGPGQTHRGHAAVGRWLLGPPLEGATGSNGDGSRRLEGDAAIELLAPARHGDQANGG